MSKDDFKFIIPADLEKSEDGEWKIKGLASTGGMDQQGETILQKGIDLTPIDKRKGILNFDHQKGPENTIGLLDGYKRTEDGLYVEGRLFKNHSRAKAVYEIMSSLNKSDRGRVGLSVEGKILKRNDQNPKIIEKCQINAVAVTMNPVNSATYADLIKSMNSSDVEFNAKEDAEEINGESNEKAVFTASQVVEIVEKALGAGAAGMVAPVDRSGGEALSVESMDKDNKKRELDDDQDEKEEKPRKKLKKMKKSLYKSKIIDILDKLQTLHPDCSRSEIWESVKERLDTKFPELNDL